MKKSIDKGINGYIKSYPNNNKQDVVKWLDKLDTGVRG